MRARRLLLGLGRILSKRQVPVAMIAIVCAFAAVHGDRVLRNLPVFQWEDRVFIQHNSQQVHSLADCFTKRPVWPGLYRPVTTNLYYFAGRKIFSNRVEVHHLINVALHLANGFLLFLVSRRLLSYPWALVPPLLFVSRASHAEVVGNTCEFQALLSVFLTLLAFELFVAGSRKASVLKDAWPLLAFALALLSKETAVVFPVLLLVYRRLFDEGGSWRRYIGPWVVAAAWAVLFVLVFRGVSSNDPTGFAYQAAFWTVAGIYAAYLLAFINLLTHGLASVIMVPGVSGLAATVPARVGIVALFAAASAFLVLHRRLGGAHSASARVAVFGILFFGVATAPFVILAGRLFMRYAYLGHAGLAISSGAVLLEVVGAVRALATRRLAAERN